MGTETPKERQQTHAAEQRDELPIQDLKVEPDKEQSEKIRGGATSLDTEANSEKIK
jgi:hypothetical protein